MPALNGRRDPAPPRWRYRLARMLRRRALRNAARILLPPLAVVGLGVWLASNELLLRAASDRAAALRDALAQRPEFAVTELELVGGSGELEAEVAAMLIGVVPASSLDLDLEQVRLHIEASPRVARANVTITPEGLMRVTMSERVPVALWRRAETLHLIDREGVSVGVAGLRSERPDLPLLVGEGAETAAEEALVLDRRLAALRHRLRALVRVGERRWDVVLDRNQRIMLPEAEPEAALARALALNYTEDLLERGVVAVDMRNAERPTLRLRPESVEDLLRLRRFAEEEDA